MLTTTMIALSLVPIHVLPPPRIPHHVRLPRRIVQAPRIAPRAESISDAAYHRRLRFQLCEAKPWLFCDPEFLAG